MDTGLVISLFIIVVASFILGLVLGLSIGARQVQQLTLMHAQMMATAFWVMSGGELEPAEDETEEKRPATVLPFRVKGPGTDDTDQKEPS